MTFLHWSWAACALNEGMEFHHLKFYRNFAVEVFIWVVHKT